jgi:hypothetical protein
MNENVLRDKIIGSRNINNYIITIILFLAGIGFFLTGLSSFFHENLFWFTDTRNISFFPQGIVMIFYGTAALGIAGYLVLTIIWDIGSGYNEFSKEENNVRIIRLGFPGKNRKIFLSYDFKTIKSLKLLTQQGLNPRYNIILILKDKREIPLFPSQFLLNPKQLEKKAIEISTFLNVPLENIIT